MGKNSVNLQDVFLNKLRKDHAFITIFLVNGFQVRGIVKGFDNFTVVVEGDGKQQLIYKHAISTIQPSKPVNYHEEITECLGVNKSIGIQNEESSFYDSDSILSDL